MLGRVLILKLTAKSSTMLILYYENMVLNTKQNWWPESNILIKIIDVKHCDE